MGNIYYSGNDETRDYADQYGGLDKKPGTEGGIQDQYDAYRHALTSAWYTQRYNDEFAKQLGDLNENVNREPTHPQKLDEFRRDENMDRWNNNVGREEYYKWQEATETGATTDSLEKWIYDRVKDGETINDLDDPRRWEEPTSEPRTEPGDNESTDDLFDPVKDYLDDLEDQAREYYEDAERWVKDLFDRAKNWLRRFDPLVLDLDGDGIETIAADGTVMFDHDGDRISNGTGWISGDDGILVIDKNGNGFIDDGSELFGDSNPDSVRSMSDPVDLSAGLVALRKYDSNHDDVFDAQDAAYSTVKVWRDLNQDGVSQGTELFSLAEVGIESVNLVPTSTENVTVGNSNVADSTGEYTRLDGTKGTFHDLQLADNSFYREFKDPLPLSDKANSIASARGSGMVRDLREAATLDDALADGILALIPGMSRDEMMSRMDAILLRWANTSSMKDTRTIVRESGWMTGDFTVSGSDDSSGTDLSQIVSVLERFMGTHFFGRNPDGKLTVGNMTYAASESSSGGGGGGGSVILNFTIQLESGSADLLRQSYDLLKGSVYAALVLQTRLKDYVQDIEVGLDGTRLGIDTAKLLTRLGQTYAANSEHGLEDAADLLRYAGRLLGASGLHILAQVESWAAQLASAPEGDAVLADAGFTVVSGSTTLAKSGGNAIGSETVDNIYGQDGADTITAGAGNDYLYARGGRDILSGGQGDDRIHGGAGDDVALGGEGADRLYGEDGADVLLGADGDDQIYGGNGADSIKGGAGDDLLQGDAGNDRLEGGAGNDTLSGGGSNDAYVLNRGDGQDRVRATADNNADRINLLILGQGIAPSDITLRRVYDDQFGGDGALQISILNPEGGPVDSITFNGFLYQDDPLNPFNELQTILFGDGTIWTLDDILTNLFAVVDGSIRGTVDNDVLHGTEADNKLRGLAGNDTLQGEGGNDELYGGADDDTLLGGASDDSLDGGADDDLLEGGAGNDRLNGGVGNNIYRFGLGDGQDVIASVFDDTAGKASTLEFKTGVAVADVMVSQVPGSWGSKDLLLQVGAAGDQVLVKGFYDQDNPYGANNPLQQVRFADGTVWTVADLLTRIYAGTEVDDNVSGTVADDGIQGGLGSDQLYGRAGNDTLTGGSGNDSLYGEAGQDVLLGGSSDDALYGGNDDDVLDGGIGNDHLVGGWGNNRYLFGIGDGQDIIVSERDDSAGKLNTLAFKSGVTADDIVLRQVHGAFGSSDLEVSIADTGDKLTLQQFIFNDSAEHASNPIQRFEFADGTAWSLAQIQARLFAGTMADDVLRGTTAADTIHGAVGNDRISGGTGTDVIDGGDGNDWLDGQQDDDTLLGGAGDDYLHGCDGDDILDGGVGNDRFVGNAGQNVFRFGRGDGQDAILDNSDQGIGSFNTLELKANVLPEDITLMQVAAVPGGARTDLRIGISGTNDFITIQNYFQDHDPGNLLNPVQQVRFANGIAWSGQDLLSRLFAGTAGDDLIEGTTVDDAIRGAAGSDTLIGMGGNDTLHGDAGNDVLDGDIGADELLGGQDNDLYRVDNDGDVVLELANEGQDTIESNVSYTLSTHVEILRLVGDSEINATGNAADNILVGNSAENVLTGGAGHDILDGGGGIDTLIGDTGNDTYHVNHLSDVIVERVDEGFDTAHATSDYILSDHIEKLVLGGLVHAGTGNALDNELVGNEGSNRLNGGAGSDVMRGGQGNETYVVDNTGDEVVELADEGSDTVESSIDYTLGSTLENLTLTGAQNLQGTGNAGDNVLVGNTGDNRLDGGLGGDDMYGGSGNDTFINDSSSDWIYENEGEGLDTVERRYETNLVLSDNVENLILADGIKTGNGNGLDNLITGNAGKNTLGGWDGSDELRGLDGDDALFGGTGSDLVLGGAGLDYLDGGEGIDQLEGGTGDDTYIVDNGSDVVMEVSGAGDDKVQTTASYTLTANVETLFLQGAAAIDGTGNTLDNYLAGNGAANVISGAGGNDTLAGGGGNDTLIGGVGDDKYVVSDVTGSDVINNDDGGFDGVFFNNGVTREQLSFSRDGNDLLITVDGATTPAVRVQNHFLGGNAAIDYVQPNDEGPYLTTAQINQIVGGGGTGGEYDQVIEGTASGEQLVGSAGRDLIKGFGGADQLFGMGGDDTLQGDDGDDYLAGGNGSGSGSGADRLEGGAGNDTLAGQDGNDTLIGGIGDDDYVYGGGQDTIDNSDGGYDGIFFNNGIDATRLGFSRDGDDLLITVDADPGSAVRVTGHFLGGDAAIDFVMPDGSALLDTAAINALADSGDGDGGGDPGGDIPGDEGDYSNTVDGTASGEQLLGSNARDLMHGLGGDDTMFAFGGDDRVEGGDGNDDLYGGNGSFSGSGNDILVGGAGSDSLKGEDGDDYLMGGAGDDSYYYTAESGSDIIDNTGGGSDYIYFASIASGRLSFHRDGDDLIVRVDGDAGKQSRVLNHFLGGEYAIAFVQPSDANAIPASQFEALLTPMGEGSANAMLLDGTTSIAMQFTRRQLVSDGQHQHLDETAWNEGLSYLEQDGLGARWELSRRISDMKFGPKVAAISSETGRTAGWFERLGLRFSSQTRPEVPNEEASLISHLGVQRHMAALRLQDPGSTSEHALGESNRELNLLVDAIGSYPPAMTDVGSAHVERGLQLSSGVGYRGNFDRSPSDHVYYVER